MKSFQFLNARPPEEARLLAQQIIDLNNRQIKERQEDNKNLMAYINLMDEDNKDD